MSYLDEEKEIKPWLSMWFKPRKTVRQYLDSDQSKWIWLLVIFSGIKFFLDNADAQNVGDKVSAGSILFLSMFFGSIIGIIQWLIMSASLAFMGKFFDLHATWGQLRKAISLSYIPLVWGLLIWIVKIYAFGQENFTALTPTIDASIPLLALIVLCYLLNYLILCWYVIVLSKSVAEVYDISAWGALGLIILTIIVLSVACLILFLPFIFIFAK
ncbi:Yip1 domain-containing protein [Marininema mesophilum]|uniref:Yip1 domain-containing protein n=1 Tax=Marininema mesophilum TaxID=1048340 RepID=A0A1H2XBD7_9BACL|nr:YIP1 family protein [Marininema mesophilum]SDW90076.1 Yip1 domain-containing protein [Marininema mesophilum]